MTSVLATVAAVIALHPVRERVGAAVERMVHGDRGDPVRVLGELIEATENSTMTAGALAEAATVVGESLEATGVAIIARRCDVEAVVARWGDDGAPDVTVDLRSSGCSVGRMEVRLSPVDVADARVRRTLKHLAPSISSLVATSGLEDEVAALHRRLIAAHDEERRRLRRDLHDGLGPGLAGVGLGLRAARARLAGVAPAEADLLARLEGDLASQSLEVRRIIDGLRPQDLDALGLVGALHHAADKLRDHPMRIEVRTDDAVDRLDPLVSAVVYHVAVEAMLNASRHADATRCDVRVRTSTDRVTVDVTDDGRGIHGVPGVGIGSMRERVAEVGGHLDIGPNRPTGTVVHAELPGLP